MKKVSIIYGLILTLLISTDTLIAQNEVQRVRVNLETPLGYTRQLLLGFTPDNAATDGFDYGYDGANADDFPDDFNWIIEGNRYIIQGVGAFNETKKYPIGFFLSNSGNINVTLNALENFNTIINVYLYDSLEDSYHKINDSIFSMTIPSGEYIDRFYIAFLEPNLSVTDNDIEDINISYSKHSNELKINSNNLVLINGLKIYNINGQSILSEKFIESNNQIIFLNDTYLGVNIISLETNKGIIYKKVLF